MTIAHFAFRRACPCRGKGAFVSKAAMQDRFRCSSTDTKGYKATQGDCERFPKIPKIVTKYSQSQFQFYHNHRILELYSVARSNYNYTIIIIIMIENYIQCRRCSNHVLRLFHISTAMLHHHYIYSYDYFTIFIFLPFSYFDHH